METAPRETRGAQAKGPTPFLLCALQAALVGCPLAAQSPAQRFRSEPVSYWNVQDSTYLTATLTLPTGSGPHPGVVLLSIAGTNPIVEHLAGSGYAVLLPERRGFVSVEPLLQASYQDLASDAQAAVDYLGSREDVADASLSLIGQADDAPPAIMAAIQSAEAIPLILVAPPGFPGTEIFRLEQSRLAQVNGRPQDLQALDRLVDEISTTVLSERLPYLRESRLQALISRSSVRLPYNAAFPDDERQAHFFASPLWHDRLAFDPEDVLARLRSPVLVLIGTEEPDAPLDAYLAAVKQGLSAAPTEDWSVCVTPGRVGHSFTNDAVQAIGGWLRARPQAGGGAAVTQGPGSPPGCL